MTGIERIAAERRRQIDQKGYDASHDEVHRDSQLLRAGITHARHALQPEAVRSFIRPHGWPWAEGEWTFDLDPVRELEIAGALIAAEIDRLIALQNKDPTNEIPSSPA